MAVGRSADTVVGAVAAIDLVGDTVAAMGPAEVDKVADPIVYVAAAVVKGLAGSIVSLVKVVAMAALSHMRVVPVKANSVLMVGTALRFSSNPK